MTVVVSVLGGDLRCNRFIVCLLELIWVVLAI